jgi:hypothetical protein
MIAGLSGLVGAMIGLVTLGYTKIRRDAGWIAHEMRLKRQITDEKDQTEKVYFILNPITNHVKIGTSRKPLQRLRDLQTSSPGRLVLLATIPGDRRMESLFHRHYESCRVSGEWFQLTPKMQAHIEELQKL